MLKLDKSTSLLLLTSKVALCLSGRSAAANKGPILHFGLNLSSGKYVVGIMHARRNKYVLVEEFTFYKATELSAACHLAAECGSASAEYS